MQNDRRSIYEKTKAATVAICLREPGGGLVPFGSGVNIDPSGIVVTCKHVIEDAQLERDSKGEAPEFVPAKQGVEYNKIAMFDIVAVFSFIDEGKLELGIATFEVIHGPHDSDLAVGRLRPDTELPAVQLGNSDDVFEGQSVFTCGFPLGPDLQPNAPVGALFHRGIISGIRPHFLVKPRRELLLDMSINPGNSGGPLIAEDTGEVVGIVDAQILHKDLPTGIGCAVPSNLITPLVHRVTALTGKQIDEMGDGVYPSNTTTTSD